MDELKEFSPEEKMRLLATKERTQWNHADEVIEMMGGIVNTMVEDSSVTRQLRGFERTAFSKFKKSPDGRSEIEVVAEAKKKDLSYQAKEMQIKFNSHSEVEGERLLGTSGMSDVRIRLNADGDIFIAGRVSEMDTNTVKQIVFDSVSLKNDSGKSQNTMTPLEAVAMAKNFIETFNQYSSAQSTT